MLQVNFVVKAPPLSLRGHIFVEPLTLDTLRVLQEDEGFEITSVVKVEPLDGVQAIAAIRRFKEEIG